MLYDGFGRVGHHTGTAKGHSPWTYWGGWYLGAAPTKFSPASCFTLAPWWSSASDGTLKFITFIEAVNVDKKMVSILWHLPTEVEITILRPGSARGTGALLALGHSWSQHFFLPCPMEPALRAPEAKQTYILCAHLPTVATFWAE